jgi:pimeloyl-ACP methyl ester carboxylesterase
MAFALPLTTRGIRVIAMSRFGYLRTPMPSDASAMAQADLNGGQAPSLIVSARDDGYGTYASANYMADHIEGAQFLALDTGGHGWIGHNDAVMAAIAALVTGPLAP